MQNSSEELRHHHEQIDPGTTGLDEARERCAIHW